jgi:hypothetical protein
MCPPCQTFDPLNLSAILDWRAQCVFSGHCTDRHIIFASRNSGVTSSLERPTACGCPSIVGRAPCILQTARNIDGTLHVMWTQKSLLKQEQSHFHASMSSADQSEVEVNK